MGSFRRQIGATRAGHALRCGVITAWIRGKTTEERARGRTRNYRIFIFRALFLVADVPASTSHRPRAERCCSEAYYSAVLPMEHGPDIP